MTGRRVTALVGTDHHPFDRLVAWCDAWQCAHPEDHVRIQYGFSRAPSAATGVGLLSPDGLRAAVLCSDVVVCHGGPGTIMDVRRCGHLPLVLPRDPRHGEHVDDHQLRFSAWAAGKGLVRQVDSTGDLTRTAERLDAAGTRWDLDLEDRTEEVAQRFAALLQGLPEPAGLLLPVIARRTRGLR